MSRMKCEYTFLAGAHLGGELRFGQYNFKIDFYVESENPNDHNTATDRLDYFIQDVVTDSVFVVEDDISTISAYSKAGIPVLTVPAPGPVDPMVQAVIVTKMNTMLEDVMVITEAELRSNIGGNIVYVWGLDDDEDGVHDIVNDTDETNWWATPDPRFVSYPQDVDIEEYEKKYPNPANWAALNMQWDEDKEDEPTPPKGSKVIKFNDFVNPDKK